MPEQRRRPLLNQDQAPKSPQEQKASPDSKGDELPRGCHYKPLPSGGRMIVQDNFADRRVNG